LENTKTENVNEKQIKMKKKGRDPDGAKEGNAQKQQQFHNN